MSDVATTDELASLLHRIAAGDRGAFRRLYDLQAPRLYAMALHITRQESLAADAVQEAFLQVWRNAARFELARGHAEAWLVSLLRYRALDIARRRDPAASAEDVELPEPADMDPDPLERLASSRAGVALGNCLSRLDAERRRLLLLVFVEGLSHSEVAARLGLPLGTVKSRIRRGLQWLRFCLDSAT
jgi:RNA polymerase sigma-70 factor (ECF subfamily)